MIQTPYLIVNEHGIDIIKDFHRTTHLDYEEIIQVDIERGFLMKQWFPTTMFGLLLSFTSIIGIIESVRRFDPDFITSSGVRLYLLLQFVPWITCILGLSLVYTALRISTIIFVYTEFEKFRVAVKELEKDRRIEELVDFLKDRVVLTVGKKIINGAG